MPVPRRRVKECMGQGYDLLRLSLHLSVVPRSLSLSILHINKIRKAVRGWAGAGLHKLGVNFAAHLCCPSHIPCIPIPLTILQPRFGPRPDPPVTEGHLCTATVI